MMKVPSAFWSGVLLAAQANAGDSRRDQGAGDLDLHRMSEGGNDQNTTQPTHRLAACFSVVFS